ncbi:MAG: DMT family transporter [Acidobacteria bacterium]|nr:DMT family transporter [Acidobacteriota bacterium]
MGWRIWTLLLLAQAMWAGSYVAMKVAGDAMPVGAVVVFRYGIASLAYLFLIPIVGLPRMAKRDWALVAALGVVNFALTPTLQVQSLRLTRAADVSLLIGLEPILTVILAGLILRERLNPRIIGAMVLGLAGVWVLSDPIAAADEAASDRLWGNVLFLGSLLCEATVTISGGRLAKLYSPLPTIAAMKACGLVAAAIFYGPVVAATNPSDFGAPAWTSLIYLALLPSLFAYSAWYWAIRRVPVNQLAPTLFAQPFIGAFLGWLLLGEVLGPRTWAGGALILGALAWTQMISKKTLAPTG